MTEAQTLDLSTASALVPDERSAMQMATTTPPPTIPSMIAQAVAAGNLDMVGKLMDYQDRYDAKMARRAFDAAIADAKAGVPPIIKNREGHNKTLYADFSAFAKAVDPVLSRFGLSYRFRSRQDDRIHVTCIIAHRDGHSEENTLAGLPDKSGSKNDIQAIGSTLTYLQRYSLAQALGLAASMDDDGKDAGNGDRPLITEEQVAHLRQRIMDEDVDLPKFLARIKCERLEDIYAKHFDDVVRLLNQRKADKEIKARKKAEEAA